MVYKPKHRRLFAKSQGRDDPRHVPTAAKARAPELGSSNSRTGSVERRLLAFYTEYRPEKLLQVDDILKRYSGREEELFAALVKKYGPEPAGPNYKSKNNSVRRNSKQPTIAAAVERRRVEARALAYYLGAPDRDDVEVPMSMSILLPVNDEREVDRDFLEEEREEELELVIEQVFDEMVDNSFSCFPDMFQFHCGDTNTNMSGLSPKSHLANESLSEQMVRAYDRFLRDHHLVDTRDEEKVNERDEGESSFHDDTIARYMKEYLKGYAGGKKAFWRKSRE